MSLTPGTRLGPYEVRAAIGAGGMGEVFRARDLRLNRDVALKVLPDFLAVDGDRLARFYREAQVLASLNHPNIAQLYGFEEARPVHALVMELVEGPTLADRLAAGPLPLADALPIARQIADALAAAHEQGIIHRDLKPANVKVRDDGTVKVLDFGLAKALAPEGVSAPSGDQLNSPTLTAGVTQLGMIVGTAVYMAPEQAKGRPVDRRADVWAFGVVLHEMLTGRRLFEGEDLSETLAAVLTREPDWTDLPEETPPAIRRLLTRCLAKNPRARLDSMAVARFELDEASGARTSLARTSPREWSRRLALPAALALAGLVAGGLLSRSAWPSRASAGPTTIAPVITDLAAAPELVSAFVYGFALSPDGATLVYSARTADGTRQLWKRRLSDPRAEPIAGTDGAVNPFWSPDGRTVAFFASGSIKRVPTGGGPAQTITETPGAWPRGTWSGGADILFSVDEQSGIRRVAASGGPSMQVPLDGAVSDPQWLPDGRHFLFVRHRPEPAQLMVGSISANEAPVPVLTLEGSGGNAAARFSPAGYLVFDRARVLNIQRFDVSTRRIDGPVVAIGREVGTPRTWFAVSVAGTTVAALNPDTKATGGTPGDPIARLNWVDRKGRTIGEVGTPARYWTLALSPDDTRVAVNPDDGIWTIDAATGLNNRVASGTGALWLPNGRDLLYRHDRGLEIRPAAGEGQARRIHELHDRTLVPTSVSPDGTHVALTARAGGATKSLDLVLLTIANGSVRPVLATDANECQASFSPDGQWLAYASDQTGRLEIYVRPLAGGSAIRVSAEGGQHPMWRRDGREMFFLSPTDEIIAVDMSAFARGGSPGGRTRLFQIVMNDVIRDWFPPFAVGADGQRFLVSVPERPEPLTLIQHVDALFGGAHR